jgi:hypothetical protein
MIHHEGTKDTKGSSAVQDASHAASEEVDVEIEEEADGP